MYSNAKKKEEKRNTLNKYITSMHKLGNSTHTHMCQINGEDESKNIFILFHSKLSLSVLIISLFITNTIRPE